MAWLHTLLGGSSPITGYLGSLIIALSVVDQVLREQGPPHDAHGWLLFLGAISTGLAVRFAKDANKSHAYDPQPVAQPVRAASDGSPYQVP